MSDGSPNIEVIIARFEGKLDAALLQQGRHEDRLNAQSAKIDSLQTQVTEAATKLTTSQETQREAKRHTPSWPTVVSAVVAASMMVLFVAQQIYSGG